jgi:3-hydroxybutyryl-CoA dehydrogenase
MYIRANIVELMCHPTTANKYYDEVFKFAKDINMIPCKIKKEQPGYVINSLLVPFLLNGLQLWANEVSDFESIDITWSTCFGGYGPFQLLDIVGLTTAYNIMDMFPDSADPTTVNGIIKIKLKEMIDANKIGRQSGEGFYKYS